MLPAREMVKYPPAVVEAIPVKGEVTGAPLEAGGPYRWAGGWVPPVGVGRGLPGGAVLLDVPGGGGDEVSAAWFGGDPGHGPVECDAGGVGGAVPAGAVVVDVADAGGDGVAAGGG